MEENDLVQSIMGYSILKDRSNTDIDLKIGEDEELKELENKLRYGFFELFNDNDFILHFLRDITSKEDGNKFHHLKALNYFEKWTITNRSVEDFYKCPDKCMRQYNKFHLLLEFISYEKFPILQEFCIAVLVNILKKKSRKIMNEMVEMGAIPLFINLSYKYSYKNYNVLYILKLFIFGFL